MKAAAIIPARYASTRFPGKPLVQIAGKPLVQWVYERVSKAKNINRIIVATDDQRIFRAVRSWGGEVVMTSSRHQTGSDRIAEVAKKLKEEIIVNVQGDEPLIRPKLIDSLVDALKKNKTTPVVTTCCAIESKEELSSPNVVKVIFDLHGRALYFSRYCLPFVRDTNMDAVVHYKHMGIYAYQRDFLLKYIKLKPTRLESLEKLEQLRILEHGYSIQIVMTKFDSIGVDTPEDITRVEKLLQNGVKY